MNVTLYERTLTYTAVMDDNYICHIYIYILVSVVYVTVRVHLVRFKLIANKTDEHRHKELYKWVFKYRIMYLKTCVHVSSILYSDKWGGGGRSEQHRRYNCIRIYIYCMFYYFVSLSSCSLASTSMISKYIKLLVLTTINYALHLESTSLKVHVYHIIELFIYAFKFQCIVTI